MSLISRIFGKKRLRGRISIDTNKEGGYKFKIKANCPEAYKMMEKLKEEYIKMLESHN